jgi:hypothetical protein
MAAVEATTKALEQVTVSKTKELKGASTPHAPLTSGISTDKRAT